MAGQRETSRTMGRETEEAWLKRMSEPGAIAPASNILGFQNAVRKKKSTFLSNAWGTYVDFIERGTDKVSSFLSGLGKNKHETDAGSAFARKRRQYLDQ